MAGCSISWDILKKRNLSDEFTPKTWTVEPGFEGCLRLLGELKGTSIYLSLQPCHLNEIYLWTIWPRIISCWHKNRVVLRMEQPLVLPPIIKTLIDDKSWTIVKKVPRRSAGSTTAPSDMGGIRALSVRLVPTDEDCDMPICEFIRP